MLLAIDVGNTQTVYGVWDGQSWRGVWRRSTNAEETEDQLAAWLKTMFDLEGLPFEIDQCACASVVPALNDAIARLSSKRFSIKPLFLAAGSEVGVKVKYDPPSAVGADRIANAVAALERFKPPIVVVDFGTATTFDCVDREGAYAGGAILPGIMVSAQALVGRTAKLPQVEFTAPEKAVGRNTSESLQSGIMLGYAGAIDTLARKIKLELGDDAKVIATGGLGEIFLDLCDQIESYEPRLTLDGIRIASERLNSKSVQ